MNINEFASQISQSEGFARQNRYQVFIPVPLLAQNSTKIANISTTGDNSDGGTDWMGDDYFDTDANLMQQELAAYCEKSQLPSYQFQLLSNRSYGPMFKIPHLPEYQDITMTFLCGSEMLERYFFEAWMYMIMDPVTNNFNYKAEYAVDMDIVQYKEKATSVTQSPLGGLLNAGIEYTDTALAHLSDLSANLGINAGQIIRQTVFEDLAPTYTVDYNYYTTLIDCFPISVNSQDLGYDINNTLQKIEVTFAFKYANPFNLNGSSLNIARRGNTQTFQSTISGG